MEEKIAFCSGYNTPMLFSKSTKTVFGVEGTCHSPNTIHIMFLTARFSLLCLENRLPQP